MPKTIVVPLDGSAFAERALRPAGEVARRAGAHVVVMTARYGGVVVEPKRYLEEAARAAGIDDPVAVVVEGRLAGSAIAAVVSEHSDPVIVMTTHARQRMGQALFGSVAEEVLRAGPIPALLVGPSVPDVPTHFAELIVCLDGSALASAILPLALAWARDLHLDVVLVRVAEADPKSTLPESDPVAGDLADLQHIASELEPTVGSVRCQILHHPRAAEAIVEFARNHPRALLALTTHGRTGLARVTAGSTAIAVVRGAHCPVLVTRPPGLD
jgi:nucleotide-binding universal stress UspA family protein